MVVDVAISRLDNTTPFGFKLVGGADFDVPLQVVKIVPGSIAEAVGVRVGDVVARINEIPTNNLSYYDAHQLLACAGNSFVLGIVRAHEVPAQQRAVKENTPCGEVEYINTSPKPFWTPSTNRTQTSEESEIEARISDAPITDEQIAEILSGEAEVLKQHNVIGVNFKKMIPSSGVFKQSEVFKTLNNELVQGEEKRHTTFMQKPARPPPKTREERLRELNPPAERYQVRIVKQPKPKIAPDYKPPKSPEPIPEPEPIPMYDEYLTERVEVEVDTIKTLESEPVMQSTGNSGSLDPSSVDSDIYPEGFPDPTFDSENNVDNTSHTIVGNGSGPASEPEEDSETSEEFREQLENVQKQLEALSSLPITIQATIAALTEQLSALAQPKRKSKSVTPRPEEGSAAINLESSAEPSSAIIPEVSESFEVTEYCKTETEQSIGEQSASSDEGEHIIYTDEQLEALQQKMKEHDIEWTDRNDKSSEESSQLGTAEGDTRTAVQDELKLQVVKKKKKTVSAFGPLTPQERPIFLPGGRKWRNAKDAFNEQFIAEVISSQAELIQGTTLGHFYESPHLGYDDRVNFLKYQKPEKDLSFIKNSDVYKLIHDQDPPKTGIELRPEMVLAEEDVRKCVSPC
ncbi:uncharacterized protein LOC129717759 isoform X3 [Wyeomyia smithii]|uniref:uncharacterized protein LOC129717759 isoform X3 n=1 Tax=Wyeomyia smithii TaxID=174621 RepID=UPI002467F5CF|nr:uncharacterized protein LOC129717759 isoform X3 [Wyeomyia smithii]